MEDFFGSDDDFLDKNEVAGGIGTTPSKKNDNFKPWHKPRKQWVRDKQWWGSLKILLQRNKKIYTEECVIKYFGLPGGDLLDIEYMRQKLAASTEHNKKKFLVHGFIDNSSDKSDADVRLSNLLDCENIDERSKVDKFNFGSLSHSDSVSWNKVKDLGPYHLINLDFCDCALKKETLTSILMLMNFQFKRQLDIPWLLCITSRTNRGSVNDDVFKKLDDLFEKLQEESDLLEAVALCFSATCTAIDSELNLNNPKLTEGVFSILLQVCFILWFITYSITHHTTVELISSMKYKVHLDNEFPDMCSFVFRFYKEDEVVPDQSGLVSGGGDITIPLEKQIEAKCKALVKLSKSLDIDRHFADNPELMVEYSEQMKVLLGECGWDVTNYCEEVCS